MLRTNVASICRTVKSTQNDTNTSNTSHTTIFPTKGFARNVDVLFYLCSGRRLSILYNIKYAVFICCEIHINLKKMKSWDLLLACMQGTKGISGI